MFKNKNNSEIEVVAGLYSKILDAVFGEIYRWMPPPHSFGIGVPTQSLGNPGSAAETNPYAHVWLQ